jgi:type II secretory pathway component HofQ
LRKIPLIGALFGTEGDRTDRAELFIFITPRILNEKEAGLNT